MVQLHTLLALDKSRRADAARAVSEIRENMKDKASYNGENKTYRPLDAEDPDTFPDEVRAIKRSVKADFAKLSDSLGGLWSLEFEKDVTNNGVMQDVVVDGEVLFKDAPTSFLMFLESQVEQLMGVVAQTPIPDDSKSWAWDDNAKFWTTSPQQRRRTLKREVPEMVIAPTENHPGQWTTLTRDEVVGHWVDTSYSLAYSRKQVDAIMERLKALLEAVKVAKAEANKAEVSRTNVDTKAILNRLLGVS